MPLLTTKDVFLIMRGRLYSSCVQSSMLHRSETCPVRKENIVVLQRAEMRMVRWMYGVMLKDRLSSKEHNRLTAFVQDYRGRLVPEETFTHSHPSWSSDILYQLPPFTTIHGILFVQFTSLTVLSDNFSPGPLWSSSWPWTLNFILHAFLHPIIIIFSQHMPIPTQSAFLVYPFLAASTLHIIFPLIKPRNEKVY